MQSTSNKGSKGSIGVANVKNRVRLNLPRQWFGGKQEQRGLGLDWSDDNEALARRVAKRLELDFQEGKLSNSDGTFNEEHYQKVLTEYGIKGSLRVVKGGGQGMHDTPQKPAMSILEIWDMYCEYKRSKLAITTYELKFKKLFYNPIVKAIAVVGEDAIKIHNWLLENYNHETVKNVLSHLSFAYRLAIKQKLITYDPFDGLSEEISLKTRTKIIDQQSESIDDKHLLDKTKAYTWKEANIILEHIKQNPKIK